VVGEPGRCEPADLLTTQSQFLAPSFDPPAPSREPVGTQFCLEPLWTVGLPRARQKRGHPLEAEKYSCSASGASFCHVHLQLCQEWPEMLFAAIMRHLAPTLRRRHAETSRSSCSHLASQDLSSPAWSGRTAFHPIQPRSDVYAAACYRRLHQEHHETVSFAFFRLVESGSRPGPRSWRLVR